MGLYGVVAVVGRLSFDVQGRGLLPNLDPFGQTEKWVVVVVVVGGGGGVCVQKLDIFYGCHKCMVPNVSLSLCPKSICLILIQIYEDSMCALINNHRHWKHVSFSGFCCLFLR